MLGCHLPRISDSSSKRSALSACLDRRFPCQYLGSQGVSKPSGTFNKTRAHTGKCADPRMRRSYSVIIVSLHPIGGCGGVLTAVIGDLTKTTAGTKGDMERQKARQLTLSARKFRWHDLNISNTTPSQVIKRLSSLLLAAEASATS